MANLGAIHLGLLSVGLTSSGFTLWSALVQDTLQLCVCIISLLLEIALVTLSTLLLHWTSGEAEFQSMHNKNLTSIRERKACDCISNLDLLVTDGTAHM